MKRSRVISHFNAGWLAGLRLPAILFQHHRLLHGAMVVFVCCCSSSSCFRLAATQPASPLDQQARITRAARSITMLITDLVNSPVVPPLVDGCYLSSQKASVCRAAATTLLLLLLRAAALRPTSIFCYVPTYKAMEATSRSSLQPLPHSGSLRDPSGPVPLSSYSCST